MSATNTVAIGGDHAGYELKKHIINYLDQEGYIYKDFGPSSDESVDYPDFAHPVADAVQSDLFSFGILICGSANGVAMSANKHRHIRAAVCWTKEIAELARKHNKANVLCIPSRFVSEEEAIAITDAFLDSFFEGGRHERRVEKIGNY